MYSGDQQAGASVQAPRFPTVSLLAPLIVSAVLMLVFRSPFALIVGIVGPVVALANFWEAKRNHRRQQDEVSEDAERARQEAEQESQREQGAFRSSALARDPDVSTWLANPLWRPREDPELRVRIGVDLTPLPDSPARGLSQPTRVSGVPTLVSLLGGVAVVGDGPRARAVYRHLAVSGAALIASASRGQPGDQFAPQLWDEGHEPPTSLPLVTREGREILLERVAHSSEVSPVVDTVIRAGESSAQVFVAGQRVDFAIQLDTLSEAGALWALRRIRKWLPASAHEEVEAAPPADRRTLWFSLDGRHYVDIVHDGPHLLVWGQTGRGKTVCLRRLIGDVASRYSPDLLSVVLIDFKGGSAAIGLDHLPHMAGILTDLHHHRIRAVSRGLRSEIERREWIFQREGVADLADLPDQAVCPRTLIVIDEIQVLLQRHPDLVDLIGDVAARGRSLGLHLVVAGQRLVSGAPRSVVANSGLRICLGVTDLSEAQEYLPGVSATDIRTLSNSHPGHYLLYRLSASLQRGVVEMTAGEAETGPRARPLWSPALPDRPRLSPAHFALAEDPTHQRLTPLSIEDTPHGGLLLVGDSDSGLRETTAGLMNSARAAGYQLRGLGDHLDELVDHLHQLARDDLPDSATLLVASQLSDIWAQSAEVEREALSRVLVATQHRLDSDATDIRLLVPCPPGPSLVRTLLRSGWPMLALAVAAPAHRDDLGLGTDHPGAGAPLGRGVWQGELIQARVDHPESGSSPIGPAAWPLAGLELTHPNGTGGEPPLWIGPPELLAHYAPTALALNWEEAVLARPLVESHRRGSGVILLGLSPAQMRQVWGLEHSPPIAPGPGRAWWCFGTRFRLITLEESGGTQA